MKAIIKKNNYAEIAEMKTPVLADEDSVLIKVILCGVCLTDIYTANGLVSINESQIIGHEVVGEVIEDNKDNGFRRGDIVVVFPVVSCGKCLNCKNGQKENCLDGYTIGIDRHGVFAEVISVPRGCLYKVNNTADYKKLVFFEPVCSCLSVISELEDVNSRILLVGNNRITSLVYRILQLKNFSHIDILRDNSDTSIQYDYVVFIQKDIDINKRVLDLIKPEGKIIIKSRYPNVKFSSEKEMITKKIIVKYVNYGSVAETLQVLDKLDLKDLYGETFDFAHFAEAFELSVNAPDYKYFLQP